MPATMPERERLLRRLRLAVLRHDLWSIRTLTIRLARLGSGAHV